MASGPWESRWAIVRELSPGGDCCTFLVRPADGTADTSFVLKTLRDAKSPERRALMAHQVAALRTLDHAGVARFVESNALKFGTTGDLYLVREYVPGPDLDAFAASAPVSLPTACALVRRVLEVLKHCHGRGVVHRNVKPSNVILRDGNADRPVLLDVGLTFNRDDALTLDPRTGRHVAEGFLYLPEDHAGGADRRTDLSDLTQCAGLLFFVVTGQCPESLADDRGRKPHERDAAHRRLGKLKEMQRGALASLFDVAFDEDPLRRWQSADSLSAAIDAVVNPSAPQAENRLAVRARGIRHRLVGHPELTRQQTAERFAKDVVSWVTDTMNAVNAELADVLTIGMLLARPKRGGKKLTMNFVFTHRHDHKRRMECGISTVLDNQEMVLVAECLGRTGEVVRVGLYDPAASDTARTAVEAFLMDTAEHFASGIS